MANYWNQVRFQIQRSGGCRPSYLVLCLAMHNSIWYRRPIFIATGHLFCYLGTVQNFLKPWTPSGSPSMQVHTQTCIWKVTMMIRANIGKVTLDYWITQACCSTKWCRIAAVLFLAWYIGGRKAAAVVWDADGPHIPIDLFIQTILWYPAANEDSDISQAYLYKCPVPFILIFHHLSFWTLLPTLNSRLIALTAFLELSGLAFAHCLSYRL